VNILLLYYEPIPAGQTTHVLSLAQRLARPQYQITVALPAHLRSRASFEQAGVRVVPLPMGKVLWAPAAVLALVRLIRQHNFDIVHIHSQEAGLAGRIVARLAGAKHIVYTPQTIDIRRARWHWVYARIECALAGLTDVIISVNEADRGRLIGWGIPANKVVTIPNGIDLDKFNPVDPKGLRRSLGLDDSRPVVMQVGRLSAQKDPLAFVEGAARVVRRRAPVQFALAGEGPLREAVAARAQALGLGANLHLLGWRADAWRLMAAADIISLTSRWEGTPYALLEAMASSRPVVATAVNGCLEVVEDGRTGFLTPPGDVDAWAARVIELLDDPQAAARLGQRGQARAVANFSLREMAARIESVYTGMARVAAGD
jgi:glycosyltransferase involved in cell wall biosynthesis